MRRLSPSLMAVIAVAAISAPALAAHGGIHPTFRTEDVFFHCTGPTKAQNANHLLGSGPVPWNTSAPSQSYTQGAGCGVVDSVFYATDGGDSPYDAVFNGTFTGNLRSMTVKLHNLLLGQVRVGGTTTLGVRLFIDGEPLLSGEEWGAQADVVPVLSSTGLSEYLEFSITGLGSATEIRDSQGNVIGVETSGLATEDGVGTTVREISLVVTPFYTPYNNAFVWDATEIASGIGFNPPTLAAAKVAATPPGQR